LTSKKSPLSVPYLKRKVDDTQWGGMIRRWAVNVVNGAMVDSLLLSEVAKR
jgi:hypothetical protein